MRARKRFGQHFLTDPAVLERIGAVLALQAQDKLLEIGPGNGALTEVLYGHCDRFIGVEIDRDLIAMLKARFTELEVVNADVLRLDFREVFAGGDWRIAGNLPYNISTPLMVKLFAVTDLVRDMHFMVQREVAMRLAASPGSKAWGRLTVLAQYHCRIEVLFDVPPESFKPAPKVHSQVIRLTPRAEKLPLSDPDCLETVVRTAFSQRRKRVSNALKSFDFDWQAVGIPAATRPDQLSVEDFVKLANTLELQCRTKDHKEIET
ncbi:MAG: 16S rRNA (adenine(1518)-N(6)/adenine(1519)-N(6))-dimethyltransferase RsmA [Gammaproteobacteria bacterium]|nr:16S rRNA (adenine(1518)-N(6)/adenine(1519)-N(6))-dimethyltransferase RsmA [Gammaproteobacteria bacterium]